MKKLLFGLVFTIACLSMGSIVFAACVVPTDGMTITNHTLLCPGTYDLPNGIWVQGELVILDCNGAILRGDGTSLTNGITINGGKVTIKNCQIENYKPRAIIATNWQSDWGATQITIIGNKIKSDAMISFAINTIFADNEFLNANLVFNSANNNKIINNSFLGSSTLIFQNQYFTNNVMLPDSVSSYWPVGNEIYSNTFETSITLPNNFPFDKFNQFCVNGIGNTYLNGATGPTCPDTTNLEPRVSALESWRTTIDTWKATIDSWKATIDSWKSNIDSAITNILSQLSGIKYAMITINSPLNQTYSTSSVRIDLKVSQKVNALKMSTNGGSYTTLCSNCNYYNATRSFSTKRSYNVTFQAFDLAGNVLNIASVVFTRS